MLRYRYYYKLPTCKVDAHNLLTPHLCVITIAYTTSATLHSMYTTGSSGLPHLPKTRVAPLEHTSCTATLNSHTQHIPAADTTRTHTQHTNKDQQPGGCRKKNTRPEQAGASHPQLSTV